MILNEIILIVMIVIISKLSKDKNQKFIVENVKNGIFKRILKKT